MTDKRTMQSPKLPKRFADVTRGLDRRRIAELERIRPERLAKLRIPPAKTKDLKIPWLRLSPLRAEVEGKGRVGFHDPSFVGFDTLELAAFDAAYEKKMPGGFEIVRGALGLTFESDSVKSLVEIIVFAHTDDSGSPVFEIWADNGAMQTHQVKDAQAEVLTIVAHGSVWMRLKTPGATNANLIGTGGSWAFYEAKVTPLD